MVTRRDCLKGSLAWPIASLAWPAHATPALSAAPVAGHFTATSVRLWLRPKAAGALTLRYWAGDSREAEAASLVLEAREQDNLCVTAELAGLAPGSVFRYRVLAGAEALAEGRFRTAPKPGPEPRDFRVYLGSCLYTETHTRGGSSYGGDLHILDTMAARLGEDPLPHFMLWLGDNLYLRGPSRTGEAAEYSSRDLMAARYAQVRSHPILQKLLAATHHYAIWDDHDYGPDNADGSFAFKDESLRLFRAFWPNPPMGSPELPGAWARFTHEDADFFLLDDRFNRVDEKTQPGPDKRMYGEAQMAWLKAGLRDSRATFKIVAGGSQFLSESPNGVHSGWHNYPAERDGFLAWLAKERIPGVAFVSGDRHNTQFFRHVADGRPVANEFSCSPLTSRVSRLTASERANPRLDADAVVERRNFGTLAFAGRGDSRQVTARCFDADGQLLWARALARATSPA